MYNIETRIAGGNAKGYNVIIAPNNMNRQQFLQQKQGPLHYSIPPHAVSRPYVSQSCLVAIVEEGGIHVDSTARDDIII